MRQKTLKYRPRRASAVSFVAAIIFSIIGFLISLPFIVIVIFLGSQFHFITFYIALMLLGFVIGGPMMVFGVISLLIGNKNTGSSSTAELDLGRIRYTVETDRG